MKILAAISVVLVTLVVVAWVDYRVLLPRVFVAAGRGALDNADRDYFYWSPLDAGGNPVPEIPASQQLFSVRVAFKAPNGTESGALFCLGHLLGAVRVRYSVIPRRTNLSRAPNP